MKVWNSSANPAVRYSALAVAAITAIFLVWVVIDAFGPDTQVVPTNGVTARGSTDNPAQGTVRSALDERAQLQRWRGSESRQRAPEASSGDEPVTAVAPPRRATLEDSTPQQVVAAWQANRSVDAPILNNEGLIQGVSSLPGPTADVFVQPEGRDWRRWHNGPVTYGGGIVLFGALLALALFLFARGRVRIKDGFSGSTIERFSAIERANHWMTATGFVLAGLTGLVLLYGRYLVRPWLGADLYDGVAEASAWLHMIFMVPFIIGIVVMIGLWSWQNLPSRLDWRWLKRFGGFLSEEDDAPPARRFNAGQKLIFWSVVLGGLALLVSGLALMFPFFLLGYDGMQWAQIAHAAIGLILVAVIFGHIYIGTVGMQGAFDAMWSGQVDENWAKEHHSIWYREKTGKSEAAS